MSAAATTAPSGGNNVLSDKVSRALHVRTDTPAMRAALDALAGLPAGEGGHRASGGGAPSTTATAATTGSGSGGVIDARSVRAAIEEDALRRALAFQSELRRLAGDATALRERVDRVAGAASLVRRRVEGQIVEAGAGGESNAGEDDDLHIAGGSSSSAGDAWEEERTLASRLAVAQKACVEAARRQKAVDAFLDKFDLGEDEARLLDHYNFEGFVISEASLEGDEGNPWGHPSAALHIAPDPSAGAVDEAMAFLDALERLAVIRRELTKAFGSGGGGAGAGDEFHNEASFDGDDGGADEASGSSGRLGTHSALRMMEHLAARQERAHERLYLFVQFFLGIGSLAPTSSSSSHAPTSSADQYSGRPSLPSAPHGALGRFRDGDEVDEAYAHPVVRRALHALRHSRSRRAHALELVAAGRRTEVTRRFLLALTSGYGGAAPLEMGAHDPVGYVGDMLAFAFRAFRVEGELVRTLFEWKDAEGEGGGGDEGNDGEGGEKNEEENAQVDVAMDEDEGGGEEGEKPMDVAEMLAQSMGGLARPLRTRVSQVVHSLASQGGEGSGHGQGDMNMMPRAGVDDDASSSSSLNRLVALFSVCGLIRFYGSAVEKALDKLEGSTPENPHGDNPFFTTCDECLAEAADSYVASLRAFGAMLGTHSLSSSESEAQLANRAIVRISEERVASPGFAEDIAPAAEAEDEVSKQLSLPFLVAIMVEAAVPHLKTLDDCAALKAALGVSTKCGLKASESAKWSELIQGTETNLVESFVDAETDEVLQVCGLEGLRSALRHMDGAYVEGMTMASHPGLSQASVEAAMKKFYSSLYSPPIPTFEEVIRDAELRKVARSKTAERVVDVYRELYEAIMSEKGGYDDISFLGHTPTQVKTLLSM